jgi:hypothetical protein
MQCIRLRNLIHIAERELPEHIADWVDTKCVQSINIVILQQLWVNMLVTCVIMWSKGGIPHQRTITKFHTSVMSHMSLEQPWLVLDNLWPRPPREGNILAGIHQHNPISGWGQGYQDAEIETAKFQPQNAMLRLCFLDLLGDMAIGRRESECCLLVYGRYLFEY